MSRNPVVYLFVIGQAIALMMLSETGAQDFDGAWYTRDVDLHRYFFTYERFTWNEAKEFCANMSGYLITISSKEENQFLKGIESDGASYWIGLRGSCNTRSCHSFDWVVNEGGDFQDWASGHPISDSACVEAYFDGYRQGWRNGYRCKTTRPAVCEFVDDCFPDNPCNASDVCQSVAHQRGHSCVAAELVNECASKPCQNGATCSMASAGGWQCACASGWEGTDCSTEVNECDSDPCQNGATCNELVDGYTCSCVPGYTGK